MTAAPTPRARAASLRPPPGWTTHADVVVIGSGIAGLTAALRLREPASARSWSSPRTCWTPGSTQWAQGGIAAALGPGRHPRAARARHPGRRCRRLRRGGRPGAGHRGPGRGPRADRAAAPTSTTTRDGELSLTREGGHHRDRIAHAGGDATGAEIQRALIAAVAARPRASRSSSTRWSSTCCSARTAASPASPCT